MFPRKKKGSSLLGTLADGATLDTAGNLFVHGPVMAPIIHDRDVTVGLNGRVVGMIKARAIIVEGEVEGDLHAADFIRVTGRVNGDLNAARIGALPGARLRGRIVMRHRADPVLNLDESSVDRLLTQL